MEISPQYHHQNRILTGQDVLRSINVVEQTKDIIQFFNGGVEVCTPPITSEKEPLLKTLIQPDGDVITRFEKSALDDIRTNHHIVQEHFREVSIRLNTINIALKIIHWGKYLYIPIILGSIYNYYLDYLIRYAVLSISGLFLLVIRLIIQHLFLIAVKHHAKKMSQGLLHTAR